MLIPFGIFAASGAAPPTGDYELISTTVLPSDASSVILGDLGQYSTTYKHLQVRISAKVNRSVGGDDFTVRLNGDSGANYSTHIMHGYPNNTRLAYGYGNGSMFISPAAGSNQAASVTAVVADFLDAFSTTKTKTFRAASGEATPVVGLSSGAWYNTQSITSIQFLPVYATAILAGSRFSIYGIKG
jgi:hypothetical protein